MTLRSCITALSLLLPGAALQSETPLKGIPAPAAPLPEIFIHPGGIYSKSELEVHTIPGAQSASRKYHKLELPTVYIPTKPGVTFGHRIIVYGGAERLSLNILLKKTHPPFAAPGKEAKSESMQSKTFEVKPDQAAIITNFWHFLEGYEFEFVPGEWRFETFVDGQLIRADSFHVHDPADPGALFPVSVDGKWGAIDLQGKTRISPRFDNLDLFHEGVSQFIRDGEAGFVTWQDKEITPAKFRPQLFSRFSNGLAPVQVGGLYGYLNKEGRIVIEPAFKAAHPFFEGLANVSMNGKWGYIDPKGDIVIPLGIRRPANFFEGIAVMKQGELYGYMNKNADQVIPPAFEDASRFSEGLAAAKWNGAYGYVNQRGEMVIAPKYREVREFSEGLAAVKTQAGWGFINRVGKLVVASEFDDVSRFGGQHAAVKKKNKWGLIDAKGKLAIPLTLSHAEPFINGLARIAFAPGDWGFIDYDGKLVWGARREPGFHKFEQGKDAEALRQLHSFRNLGLLSARVGLNDEARKMMKLALDHAEKEFGKAHAETLATLVIFGGMLLIHKDLDSAAATLDEAIRRFREVGIESLDYANALSLAGLVRDQLGQAKEASPFHDEAFTLMEKKFGPDHPDLPKILEHYAIHHNLLKEHSQALLKLERAVAILEKKSGKDSAALIEPLTTLGSIHHEVGAQEQAESAAKRALEIARQKLQEDNPLRKDLEQQLKRIRETGKPPSN